jgi:hypothetical protein
MAVIPFWMLKHKVTVEPLLGHTAAGPSFGPPKVVRCFVQDGQRLVRGANEEQVTAASTVRMRPNAVCPVGSRLTFTSGRQSTVLAANQQDGGGFPTPDHLEVMTT